MATKRTRRARKDLPGVGDEAVCSPETKGCVGVQDPVQPQHAQGDAPVVQGRKEASPSVSQASAASALVDLNAPCSSGPIDMLEVARLIREMEAASSAFYRTAQRIGVHPFLEITGFMAEIIKLFRNSAAMGIDFTMATAHNEMPLNIEPYEAAYLGEKFDCIFGPTFRANKRAWSIFKRAIEGDLADAPLRRGGCQHG